MALKVTRLPDFTAGVINKRVNPLNAPENSVSLGENIDLSQGGIKVRPGYTLGHNATNLTGTIRSLTQAIFPTNEITYVAAQVDGDITIEWVETGTGGPARQGHTIVWDTGNSRWLLFGGETTGGTKCNDTWESSDGITWTEVTTSGTPPTARYGHVAVYNPADACMYVHGGRDATGSKADMLKLDCETEAWSTVVLSGTAPSHRYRHAGCLIGTTVLMVHGGIQSGTSVPLSAEKYYNITLATGASAEVTTTDYPNSRYAHTIAYDGTNTVYLVAGSAEDFYYNTAYKLNRTTQVWVAIANIPVGFATGLAYHGSFYCSGYVIVFTGSGANGEDASDYLAFDVTAGTWATITPAGTLASRYQTGHAVSDEGVVLVHGGTDGVTNYMDDTTMAADLCTTGAGTGIIVGDGLWVSNTHLPSAAMVFERVKTLTASSGVCTFAVLGDRLIVTEGITDVPHVFLPGTLSTDPVGSWAQPMRVLVTYDGSTYHDVSDKVLDNDLDSVADIGGVTTRGAILICCDVPIVYGFYLEFETPNTLAGATTEFSDDVVLNDSTDISREDLGNGIARWYKDAADPAKTGHFEGPSKAIAGNAVDNSANLAGTVSLPIVGHGGVAADTYDIYNTEGPYNGTHVLPAQTGGDADHLIITAAFIAETFETDDEARRRFSVGAGEDAPLVEVGTQIEFSNGDIASIVAITNVGLADDEIEISTSHATYNCDIYGVVVNDADVVSLAAGTDVPTSLVTFTPNSGGFHQGKSFRQVVKATDYSVSAALIRVKFEAHTQYSQYNEGVHLLAASIVERSGSTSAGVATPTPLTFNNGSASVDIPRAYPAWVTSTAYSKDYKVTKDLVVYQCLIAHTSGVFNDDLAAAKWVATSDPLGYVYSDFIAFTFDETKDYLIIMDLADGSGFPSTNITSGTGGSTTTPASNWSNIVFTTKPYGDTHIVYALVGQQTAATQTPTGTINSGYGIYGVTAIEGLGSLNPVTELHVATTNDTSQLDMTGADSIKQISVTETTPGTSVTYYALSVDQRQTWLIHDGTDIRTIAKLESGTWWYIDAVDAWNDTGLADSYEALRLAFAIPANQLDGTDLAATDETDWADLAGYPTLDFAIGIQADGDNLPTVTKFTVRVYDSGGSAVKGWYAGNWSAGSGWTDNTVSGVPYGQNGTILYDGVGGFEADYGVIAGIPGYWYKSEMRGTAVGTTLTKVRYRAPCQPLQNIGSGQPVAPMVVFHDTSAGKILDYSIELADETYTELSSAVVPLETTDALYVGYLTPFTDIEFIMYSDNNDNISELIAKYWNGTAWTDLTVIDGTSTDGKTLRQRGKIKFAVPSAWKSNIPLEGLTYADDSSGRMEIMYWLQLSVSASITSTTAIAEAKVQPVPNTLVKYRHAATFQNRVALANRADAPDQIAISQPFLEYVWNGPYSANYRLGGGAVTSLLSAWNTLLAGQVDRSVLITQVSGQDSDMTPVEAARHVPINRQSIVSAPMTGADDGSRSGLFFLNRYRAYCVTGLQADPNFATARFQVLSDGVNWWESTGYPRLDLDYLHLACGEYWPERNWIVWSVPMIIDYAFDPGVAVVQSTTKVKIKHTGHTRVAGESITITGLTNYSNTYTLHADTTTDWLVFTATYVAETTTRLARYSVGSAAQTTNNRLLVYDLSMGGWLPPFTISAASICTAYEYNANSPGKLGSLRLLAGNYAGQILDLFDPAATSDNGTAISAFMDTQWMTHADPEHTPEWTKEFRKLYLYGTTDNNFYIDIQKDGATTSLSTLTETALTDPVLYSFVKAFQHVDGGTIKANLFKYRFTFSGPAHVQAAKLALGYERNELSTT